jgi:hypothetical protein
MAKYIEAFAIREWEKSKSMIGMEEADGAQTKTFL